MSVYDVLFVVEDHSLLLDIAGPADAFRSANVHLRALGHVERFALRFVGAQTSLLSSVGAQLSGLEPLPKNFTTPTWVVLVGKPTGASSPDKTIEHWLRNIVGPAISVNVRLITICEGALTAAKAGLFDNRMCTTHHEVLDALARVAPRARLERNRVFVVDGPVASSAGAAAGLDLALSLIAEVCGDRVAGLVAQTLNVYVRRGTNDPEKSPLLQLRNHLSAVVHRVQDQILADLSNQWNAEAIAEIASVSIRHLDRLFLEHVGIRPRQFVTMARLERAKIALRNGSSVTEATFIAGFSSDQQFRRAWREEYGTPPSRTSNERNG
jgi:transcriptional regulator GlxA family with amidase domain